MDYDYKEKYEEAYRKVAVRLGSSVANEIFPEFTESEDERIRKEIIDLVRHSVNCMPADKFNERIAWLEKQQSIKLNQDDERIREELLKHLKEGAEGYEPAGSSEDYARWLAWFEKQADPVKYYEDKIVPKFTFDDVLALQCAMETANKIQNDKELYEQLVSLHNRVHDAYHLEKQGEQNHKIIKGKNYFCVKTHNYAGVEWIKGTKYYASDNYTLVNQGCECYCPEYSKEEHNNLFEEVKYDDCVEKQGKKSSIRERYDRIKDSEWFKKTHEGMSVSEEERKPAWSEEDERMFVSLKTLLDDASCYSCTEGADKILSWIESFKDRVQLNQEWSEEDERKIRESISLIKNNNTGTFYYEKNELISFLKSLKDRVQPKQEWSNVDKSNCQILQNIICDSGVSAYLENKLSDWLKSLKDRVVVKKARKG